MKPGSVVVKFRTVSLTVYPWRHSSGRDYWRYKHGGKAVTHATLEKATAAAKRIAEETFRGTASLGDLAPAQVSALRRVLEADPTCALVDEFLAWHGKRRPIKPASEAVVAFLAAKESNRGLSAHNVENLRKRLKDIPAKNLCDIVPADFPTLAGAARTRRNKIAVWVTFFRWCQRQGWLPHGEPTAPERLDRPQLVRSIPATWTPAELAVLVRHVAPPYLPWIALAAYAGFRTEELCPDAKSGKSPLAWEDFAWDRDLIIVRPETAKTGRRRIVPILPALRAILWPLKGQGPIGPHLPPHTPQKGGVLAETTRLGAFVGGWRRNALRHSWVSYRSALVGMSQTATEAGNSESEARKSYDDAKSRWEAEEWFASQECPPNVPPLPETESAPVP